MPELTKQEQEADLTNDELRIALEYATRDIVAKGFEIQALYNQVNILRKTLSDLCELTLAGQHEAVAKKIAQLAVNYDRINKAAGAARKVH